MSNAKQPQYEPVDGSPVKSFFVEMLTRDIKLEEAILDLLDNCVDGIVRTNRQTGKKPYQGFRADIRFKKDLFEITDNCGGIPWGLHEYAFRLGRPKDRPADSKETVGVYGIGMKRAIFKLGKHCVLSTQNGTACYEVEIKPEWIADEVSDEKWDIPVRAAKRTMKRDGTSIVIGSLNPNVENIFSTNAQSFETTLRKMISEHYAFIIDKGFVVGINGKIVEPRPTQLIFNKNPGPGKGSGIRPFIFKTDHDGVEVFLTVGFTRPLPSQKEIDEEQEKTQYSSMGAGWTVLCNDRAVLYCDRSILTGWGEAGIPNYHTQFIAISGIVEFKAKEAWKLPTTTTKRGIEASSQLYIKVKNKMREGMRLFIDYTNKWKGLAEESERHMKAGQRLSFDEIKTEAKSLKFTTTQKSSIEGSQFKPELPTPKKLDSKVRRISFTRGVEEIETVAEYLFDDIYAEPSTVGEKCFEMILKKSK